MSAPRRPPPRRTLILRVSPDPAAGRPGYDAGPDWGDGDPDSTHYELTESVAPPAPKFRAERPPIVSLLDGPARPAATGRAPLDPDTLALFRQRLVFCSLIAAVPFVFFLTCAATNFIELFGRQTVGRAGLGLSVVTLVVLLTTAALLHRYRGLAEHWLRVAEVTTFGTMALFFAYWQFVVLTAAPPAGYAGEAGYEQMASLAAAVIVNFNWFVLIVFHGVFVPNTARRGMAITVAMAAAALTISGVAALVHEATARNAGQVFALSTTILAAGAGLAVFGTTKMEALRREVLSAREAVRELGQYRLRRKLGQGGMGEVYLAEHHLLKRPCALKRIHPKYLNNPEQLRRFEREVQMTARLRHPNTVEIYDYGRADDGTFYYVMEYLNGLSLEDLVAAHGPQPPDRVVHILRQVCGALREAHRLGMVHRDIKPSNVLIFPDGAPHDQVKVVDFGLVHSLADELDPEAKITRDGLIVGTPEYMSPEQASGCAIDGRSDLFSLGSVAYYLLTGREAFHRENPLKTLLAVVNEEPKPLVNYNPHLPADLAHVVGRCLTKRPDDRFATAADLERALADCSRADLWTEDRATAWWAANPSREPGTDLNTLPLPEGV